MHYIPVSAARTQILVIALTLLVALATLSSEIRAYRSLLGEAHLLQKANGKYCSFLFPIGRYNKRIVQSIVEILDQSVSTCMDLTGDSVSTLITYAVVSRTCSSACGELGGSRIEIQTSRFDRIYKTLTETGAHSPLLIYELGRILWRFEPKLGCSSSTLKKAIHTGFAISIRSIVLESVNVQWDQVNGRDFRSDRAIHKAFLRSYEANEVLDFQNTIASGGDWLQQYELGSSNLFASMLLELYEKYGKQNFFRKFYSALKASPDCATEQDTIDNLIRACSTAANEDLCERFLKQWKWPTRP